MKKGLLLCSLLFLFSCANFESSTRISENTTSSFSSEESSTSIFDNEFSSNSEDISSTKISSNEDSSSISNSEPISSTISNSNTGTSTITKEDKCTRIIACTDYQGVNGHSDSENNVKSILSSMNKNGINSADAFFCCGDYYYHWSSEEMKKGIDSLTNIMSSYVDKNNMIFVQGNHDEVEIGSNGLSKSGNNDPINGEYGVFVINEDDYMWYNNNKDIVKRCAYNLENYLNNKIFYGFNKPIFILSHLPLNYNMRTYNDGDGKYAKYLFDVLNKAGEQGLNIIYLFGHDHSNGWDDYLGGANIYLQKGDNILIANKSQNEFSQRKLNFTYMNAGYVGYYNKVNDGCDETLTMSVFDIYDDRVEINKYSKDGKYLLKASGVTNNYKDETMYLPNEKVYNSPQYMNLNDVNNKTPLDTYIYDCNAKQTYNKVDKLSSLTNGEYLLIYKGDSNYIMKPKKVQKVVHLEIELDLI